MNARSEGGSAWVDHSWQASSGELPRHGRRARLIRNGLRVARPAHVGHHLSITGRSTGEGAWGVEVGTRVDTDPQAVDQLATKPTGDERSQNGNHLDHEHRSCSDLRFVSTQQPDDRKDRNDDDVAKAVD